MNCDPLTIADLHARYLLTCQGLLSTKGDGVRASFEQAFRAECLPHGSNHGLGPRTGR